MKRAFLVLGAVGVLSFLQLDCGSSAVSCEEALTCGGPDGGDGGPNVDGGGDGGTVQPPAGCDPTLDPKDAPKCVVNEYGVFVDGAGGNDGNAGTREAPVKTLSAALGKLNGKPRIYVCEGTYAEHVKLTTAASIYGGFACGGSWQHAGGKSKVAPTDAGYALEISNTSSAVTMSDLALVGADAAGKGQSSIAVFVQGAASVVFTRSALEAGSATEGADGQPGTTGSITAVTGGGGLNASGYAANGTTAATIKTCTCSSSTTTTSGAAGGGPSGAGALGQPDLGAGVGGLANTSCTDSEPNGAGNNGADAPGASDGAKAVGFGLLDGKGWSPRAGNAGGSGSPGQGGGGGGGRDGAGGGGGCGGCGGTGGGGGGGGGASVALLMLDSTVTLRATTLTSKSAGAGGAGGVKGAGGAGGGGGLQGAGAPNNGCPGGDGGRGGDGGSGSGGAGGVAVAVLYKGPAPVNEGSTLVPGTKGAKGVGGTPGSNDGPDGHQGESLELK